MANILKGAPVASALTEGLTKRAEELKGLGITPTLAIVRVGERPDDISYETSALKRCEKVGIDVRKFMLPRNCTKADLLDAIKAVNEDDGIHGCLLLRPLHDLTGETLDGGSAELEACAALRPEKDVDGMSAGSLAAVFSGQAGGYPPCTADACIDMLDYYGVELTGKRAAVIGRSLVIGRPLSMMLLARNATVTMCHTRTADLPSVCRSAEILIIAAGRAEMIDEKFVSPGQTVIDVGINVNSEGKLCGDVKFDAVEPIVAAISPVPSGVGSVTTAVLAKHVIEAAERSIRR